MNVTPILTWITAETAYAVRILIIWISRRILASPAVQFAHNAVAQAQTALLVMQEKSFRHPHAYALKVRCAIIHQH